MKTFVASAVLALACGLGGIGATQARANDCGARPVVSCAAPAVYSTSYRCYRPCRPYGGGCWGWHSYHHFRPCRPWYHGCRR
jgi:hypothetical protein